MFLQQGIPPTPLMAIVHSSRGGFPSSSCGCHCWSQTCVLPPSRPTWVNYRRNVVGCDQSCQLELCSVIHNKPNQNPLQTCWNSMNLHRGWIWPSVFMPFACVCKWLMCDNPVASQNNAGRRDVSPIPSSLLASSSSILHSYLPTFILESGYYQE